MGDELASKIEAQTRRNRLLVVDDELSVREILAEGLASFGFPTKSAADAREALEIVQGEEIHLVLSDIDMPEMNGIELLKALKKAESSVPFGFVTSEGTPEMREMAAENGALFLISKPFTADTFREALTPILG